MATRLDLMLEAEARGILTQEQQTLLNEARRRGMAPPAERPRAMPPTPQAKPRPQTYVDVPTAPNSLSELLGFNPGRAVARGVRDAVTNTATLPLDVAAFAGIESAGEAADVIRKSVPQIRTEGAGEDILAGITQYGLPAGIASRAAGAGMARAFPNSPMRAVPNRNVPWQTFPQSTAPQATGLRSLPAEAGAALLADFAAAGPQEGTIGDLFGGPTATSPDDTPLERRMKVGAEAAATFGAGEAALAPLRAVPQAVGRILEPWTNPQAGAQRNVAAILQEEVQNAPDALSNLAAPTRVEGVQPTTGTRSDDPGLLGLERAMRGDPAFVARGAENTQALLNALMPIIRPTETPAQEAARFVARDLDAAQAARQADLESLQREAAEAQDEVANLAAEINLNRGAAEGASERIDEALRGELARMTAEKNRLYARIDPERTAIIDVTRPGGLDEVLTGAMSPRGPLSGTTARLRQVEVVKRLADGVRKARKGGQPIAFGDLNDVRNDLQMAIRQAREAGDAGVLEALTDIKSVIDAEADVLASRGTAAGQRAKEATDYFRNEFAPRFRQGITGQRYVPAVRRNQPLPPTTVAGRYINARPGSTEAANELGIIIEGMPNPQAAQSAVRDYVISSLARVAVPAGDGKLSVGAIRRFQDRMAPALDRFPEIRAEVENLATRANRTTGQAAALEERVKAAADALRASDAERRQSVLRHLLDDDPTGAIGRVMASGNPAAEMDALLTRVGRDPSGVAQDALQRAIGDWLEGSVTALDNAGAVTLSQRRMADILGDPRRRAALERIYGEGDLKALQDVTDQLGEMNRIATGVSPRQPVNKQDANRARVILASLYGIVRGRGIFAISDWVAKQLGRDPEQAAKVMLQRAMLDPDLARTLMTDVDAARRFNLGSTLRTYVANNIAADIAQAGPEAVNAATQDPLGTLLDQLQPRQEADPFEEPLEPIPAPPSEREILPSPPPFDTGPITPRRDPIPTRAR